MTLNQTKYSKNKHGFTLIEVLVAVSIFVIIMMISGSLYVVAQRSYNYSESKMELVQNGRVAFDRISRELRQSVEIATDLATSSQTATQEILFQNGHDTEETTYVYYYLDNTDLRRAELAYYFSEAPGVYVKHNSRNEEDDLPEQTELENKIVGEHFRGLDFWQEDNLIQASSTLSQEGKIFHLKTGIYSRN